MNRGKNTYSNLRSKRKEECRVRFLNVAEVLLVSGVAGDDSVIVLKLFLQLIRTSFFVGGV